MFKLLFCVIIFFLLSIQKIISQEEVLFHHTKQGYLVYFKIIDTDTLPYIPLQSITIFPPKVFANKKERQEYYRLVYKIKKVLPYARLANIHLQQINSHLSTITNKQKKKKYIKQQEKLLWQQYGKEIKNLTVSEGRILIKLIDRETGQTSYELVKQLRGSFHAFIFQGLARLFGENLKTSYKPEKEDKWIEEIIIKINAGAL